MLTPGIFSCGRLTALGGASYVDLEWSATPPDPLVNTGRSGGHVLAKVEHIEALIKAKGYSAAVELIEQDSGIPTHYRRTLLSEVLFKGQMWEKLAGHLSEPLNSQELTYSIRARIELKDWSGAEKILRVARASKLMSETTINDLEGLLKAEKGISR
jgi:hypothetical protein